MWNNNTRPVYLCKRSRGLWNVSVCDFLHGMDLSASIPNSNYYGQVWQNLNFIPESLRLRYPSQRALFSIRLKISSSKKKRASEQLGELLGAEVTEEEELNCLNCLGFGVPPGRPPS